jgi:hypothetical protein
MTDYLDGVKNDDPDEVMNDDPDGAMKLILSVL